MRCAKQNFLLLYSTVRCFFGWCSAIFRQSVDTVRNERVSGTRDTSIFFAVILISREVGKKEQNFVQNLVNSALTGMAFQLFCETMDSPTSQDYNRMI